MQDQSEEGGIPTPEYLISAYFRVSQKHRQRKR